RCRRGARAGPAQAGARGGPPSSPPGAGGSFVGSKAGSRLPPKPTIHFGLRGMGVAPAGSDRENSGHHHLIIDAPTPPLDRPLPNDFNNLHFGAGQTEAEVSLTPGKHTLQLILGDKDHIPHNPPVMSERITVTVGEGGAAAAASGERHPSPAGASVFFTNVKNGERIAPKSVVRFGVRNMEISPSGVAKP